MSEAKELCTSVAAPRFLERRGPQDDKGEVKYSWPRIELSSKNSRLYLLGAILFLWCLAICGRLVFLQIFDYGKFVKQAGHQQQRAIPLAAKRGVIYDRCRP